MNETLQRVVETVVLLPVRVRHRRQAGPRHRARASATATVRKSLESARDLKAMNIAEVFNVGLYLLLLDQDLAEFTDDLIDAIGDRRRRFLAKQEAVLLYEAAEDLRQLLGREFRDALSALDIPHELRSQFDSVSSDLNSYWKVHQVFLGSIRNAVAAHREHDTLKYLRVMETLLPLEVMRRGAELSYLLQRLIAVLTDVAILRSAQVDILQDMRKSR